MKVSTSALIALLSAPLTGSAADDYTLGPDSMPNEGVPKGRIEGPLVFKSRIFENTVRQFWICVPAQYDPKKPAAVMVFQDGHKYVNTEQEYRVPVVLDNLIGKREMPITIGVFVNPGHLGAELPGDPWRASNRSYEYDSLGEEYARFLIEELLPEIGQRYSLTSDPEGRAIVGASSGGICAFTVAWERPDSFRKVVSHIGSFTNIRGGHVYPALVRKSARRPLRVFLQDGSNDLDNRHGNWPLANQEMAAALKFREYDYRFELGDGAHTHKPGGALLPDTLRWLWRDFPKKDAQGESHESSPVHPDGRGRLPPFPPPRLRRRAGRSEEARRPHRDRLVRQVRPLAPDPGRPRRGGVAVRRRPPHAGRRRRAGRLAPGLEEDAPHLRRLPGDAAGERPGHRADRHPGPLARAAHDRRGGGRGRRLRAEADRRRRGGEPGHG